MSAYDKTGNLIRKRDRAETPEQDIDKAPEEGGSEKAGAWGVEGAAADEEGAGEAVEDALEKEMRRQAGEEKRNRAEGKDDKLPPENLEDLRPFPLNKMFRSQPVLSEELREAIWARVVKDGVSVPVVSVEFGVSNERVGAVVRLKQMEKEWIGEGKTLARPYSKAVLAMLPKTPYDPKNNRRPVVHESINDLIVHPATRQQIWEPVSESRRFTRVDAGRAFDASLLPADDRIPHPELVLVERESLAGLSKDERTQLAAKRMMDEQAKREKVERRKAEEAKRMQVVPGRRWDFVFQDVSVESVGRDGRGAGGVGWRYGFPHEDRKKGQVKIPTRVEG